MFSADRQAISGSERTFCGIARGRAIRLVAPQPAHHFMPLPLTLQCRRPIDDDGDRRGGRVVGRLGILGARNQELLTVT